MKEEQIKPDQATQLNAITYEVKRDEAGSIEEILFKLSHRDKLLFILQLYINTLEELKKPEEVPVLREALEVITDNLDSVEFTINGNQINYLIGVKNIYPDNPENQKSLINKVNKVLDYQVIKGIIVKHFSPDQPPTKKRKKRVKAHLENFTAGQHLIKQMFNPPKSKPNLFSQSKVDEIINTTGQKKLNDITHYGVMLSPLQMQVFMGILKGFSNTNYQGDYQVDTFKGLAEVYDVKRGSAQTLLSEVYANIQKIPGLKITQADLLRLCGYEEGSGTRWGDKAKFLEALKYLGQQQFCFYWERIKKNNKGGIMFNKAGKYWMEEVRVVGTLLYIKNISEEGVLKYYEITPSPVVIDQINENYGGSYFLTIPSRWEEEVKAITGKKPGLYTSLLLLWLRQKYEEIRQHNAKGHTKLRPYEITIAWEEMAEILKMPPSLYKRNRARALKMIQKAYEAAEQIGYLREVKTGGAVDVLVLNENYYPTPGEVIPDKKAPARGEEIGNQKLQNQ